MVSRLRTFFLSINFTLLIPAIIAAWPTPVTAQIRIQAQDEEPAEPLKPEERVKAARTPEEYLALAKEFALESRDQSWAVECIEKACRMENDLLEDGTIREPAEWNAFWFMERARIREERIGRRDAESYYTIARWLNEGGLYAQARRMLVKAILADAEFAPAKELARRWCVAVPATIEFDLSLLKNIPLVVSSYDDENTSVVADADKVYIYVPFSYDVDAGRVSVSKSYLRVEDKEGDNCKVEGLIQLKSGQRPVARGTDQALADYFVDELALPDPNDPVWERIQVDYKEDDNDKRRRDEDEQKVPAIKLADQRKPLEMTGTNSAQPRKEDRTSQRDRNNRKRTVPATGYAAFIVEIPVQFNELTFSYRREDLEFKLSAKAIEALTSPTEGLSNLEKVQTVNELAKWCTDQPAMVALGALGKLASLHSAAGGNAGGDVIYDPADLQIEQLLLQGLSHPDIKVQRRAFQLMFLADHSLAGNTLEFLSQKAEQKTLESLLSQIDNAFRLMRDERLYGDQRNRGRRGYTRHSDINAAVKDLPPSSPYSNLYTALAACLSSSYEPVRKQALEIILLDGTQESVAIFEKASLDAWKMLAARFKSIEDEETRQAVLRLYSARPDADRIPKLTAGAKSMKVAIADDKDALITNLTKQKDRQALLEYLAFLKKCDFSAVMDSQTLQRIIADLVKQYGNEPEVRQAFYELALAVYDPPYEAPVGLKKQNRTRGRSNKPMDYAAVFQQVAMRGRVPIFESILATTSVDQNLEAAVGAAARLIETGRLSVLDQAQLCCPAPRRIELLQALADDHAKLQSLESWPIYLGMRLGDEENDVAARALELIEALYRDTPAEKQWTIDFALKEVFDAKRLTELSVYKEKQVARSATNLIVRMLKMDTGVAGEFENKTTVGDRNAYIDGLMQNPPDFKGTYACRMFLDLKSSRSNLRDRDTELPPEARPRDRMPVTLPEVEVNKNFEFYEISLTGLPIALIRSQDIQKSIGTIGEAKLTAQFGPAVNPLVGAAFLSPEASSLKMDQYVARPDSSGTVMCNLESTPFGTWRGQATMAYGVGSGTDAPPLTIHQVYIVLEPVD